MMSEQLQSFINMAKEDKKRAKALFFSESFKEDYLEECKEYREIYHQLLLGRNREQILEEFLITIGGKEPVRLIAVKDKYFISRAQLDEPLTIFVKKEGWGYVGGKISTESSFLSLEKESFEEADFEDGFMNLYVYLNDLPEDGSRSTIEISAMTGILEIQVIFQDDQNSDTQQEKSKQKKMFQTYVDFCTGRISLEKFTARQRDILKQMPKNVYEKTCYQLFLLHLQILEGKEELGPIIEKAGENLEDDTEMYCYFCYLKALHEKTKFAIEKAVREIQAAYESEVRRGFLLWLRMNLDVSVASDANTAMQEIKEVFMEGDKNRLLQFEACCLFGETPDLLHRLGSFEMEILEFAASEKLLNDKLIQRICFLVSREKTFSEEMLWLLLCIYKEYPYVSVLQGICALLIQGNCMDADCHLYFQNAIEEGIQLIGLQEAFFRTIPEGEYPVLPEETLTYFTYSNSLSRQEQSALYANVVKNKKRYRNLFSNYEELIRSFLEEELKKGHLNQHLSLLYHAYFEELLEDEKTRDSLGNVLFYRELVCDQRFLRKVMVVQKQKKQPDTKFLNGRIEYIEIYDADALVVFFDQEENRYIGSVSYQWKPVWNKEQIRAYCEKCNCRNEHFLLYKSVEYGVRQELCAEDFPTVLSVIDCGQLKEEYQQNIFEKVLEYYWKNGEEEQLKEALAYVDWKKLPSQNRIHMIEYFIAGGLYDEALKGIGQYGYHFIKPDLLKRVCLYALTTLSTRRSDMLVGMCNRAFECGHYNSEMLEYLQKYFKGTKEQMLNLWKYGKDSGMYHKEFVEETLRTCIRDGIDGREFPVFSEYLKHGDNRSEITDAMLVEYVDFAWHSQKVLPEEFYELIGKKLDAGKMDRLYQGLYLEYYKGKELTALQKRRISKVKDLQIYGGDILPVLFEYSEEVELPKYLYAKTFVEYQTEEGLILTFHYAGSRGQHWKELSMKELLPGYYVTSAVIFADEIMDCFITAPGEEKRRRKDIFFTDHIEKSKGSRFYELNEMLKEKHRDSIQSSMEQYILKKNMIEFIKPMTGD